jgi:hypothetical protein
MNANFKFREEDHLGYDFAARSQNSPIGGRIGHAAAKRLAGRERTSHQSRFGRRTALSRVSGVHRGGNKRRGFLQSSAATSLR